ncbi:SDR family oxidoreductase [Streptomyces angustmyceticus]|uniref:Short-chain dehydrogenase n=1 Tax=Streptomyces angustmyceticus TaxID=285578 RepID=A0A5J4L040_9ACTN|nr:SDR family oxidoreductase [Streptomyces angustmyceticus]UAL65699.1 SDR family oxidoreductase [Streptomyces angustmyceticus]GES27767.1 short-chain dehydrogenase [Streptomyces angustmyceticus]
MATEEARAGVLEGKVALVAGATRGAGRAIAVELARAGAFVYATGRSSRTAGRSEINRPETIEQTGELITAAGGTGTALRVDHLDSDQVRALVQRIDHDHGRLDILVNDIFGGDTYAQFGTTLWEHDLPGGLRMLRMGIDTHAITSHHALPLLIRRPGGLVIEMTDGTAEYNAAYRHHEGFYYDLVKAAVQRMTLAQSRELAPHGGAAVAVTPGWLRSEKMLEAFGVTEDNWREATAAVPHFCIAESPVYVARAVVALAADPDVARWTGAVVSSGQLAPLYGFTDTDGTQPDCWRYVVEVQDRGLPADDTGYR